MGSTMSEKILAKKAGKFSCTAGDILECEVDLALTHDNTIRVLPPFTRMGGEKVWDPDRVAIIVDHIVPATSVDIAKNHKKVQEFAREQRIKHYYGVSEGVCHQVLIDQKHIRPGMLLLGADSHSCTAGAIGAFAAGIGTTDMAAVFLEGRLWLRVPQTIRINLEGQAAPGVMSKDVILFLLARLGTDHARYKAIEYGGSYVMNLSLSERLTLTNMGTEMGCKTAMVEPDDKIACYLGDSDTCTYILPDEDAEYLETIQLDISQLTPQVALPFSPGNSVSVRDAEDIPIDQVFLGSCTNGRLDDLKTAAEILDGKRIAPHVRMIVTPASRQVYVKAMELGYIQKLAKSGAIITNPGCGACFGSLGGLLAPGEKCLATNNRNFRGRMGSTEAEVYLASPATAAATALMGKITNPEGYVG